MARTPRVAVNPRMLRWARERVNLSPEEAAKRLTVRPERLLGWEGWETPAEQPTLAQVRRMAALYRQTLAFFFTAEPPEVDDALRPPDFRARNVDDFLPLRLLAEIDKAGDRRGVFVDLSAPANADLPYSNLEDFVVAGAILRDRLGVTIHQQQHWKRETAFRHWSDRVEGLGVLVFHMSSVDPDDCQGFSLYFERAPVIVLNGADTPEVRTFTLFHEFAHLMLRSGGVCHTSSRARVEARCNAFAAEFLMPQGDFVQAFHARQEPLSQVGDLATRYRVSWSAIAVRMKTLGIIDQETLDEQLAIAANIAREKREELRRRGRESKSGPPHHLTQLRNLGARYVYTVLDAVQDDRINAVDASYFLDSKWGTIRSMEADLVKRAADI